MSDVCQIAEDNTLHDSNWRLLLRFRGREVYHGTKLVILKRGKIQSSSQLIKLNPNLRTLDFLRKSLMLGLKRTFSFPLANKKGFLRKGKPCIWFC